MVKAAHAVLTWDMVEKVKGFSASFLAKVDRLLESILI